MNARCHASGPAIRASYSQRLAGKLLRIRRRAQLRRQRKMSMPHSLREENARFAGTAGVSANNRSAGFRPAFRHSGTGECVESRFRDGSPAPMHVLDGLPESWVLTRDAATGQVLRARPEVVSGFLHERHFFTRDEAAAALAHLS